MEVNRDNERDRRARLVSNVVAAYESDGQSVNQIQRSMLERGVDDALASAKREEKKKARMEQKKNSGGHGVLIFIIVLLVWALVAAVGSYIQEVQRHARRPHPPLPKLRSDLFQEPSSLQGRFLFDEKIEKRYNNYSHLHRRKGAKE